MGREGGGREGGRGGEVDQSMKETTCRQNQESGRKLEQYKDNNKIKGLSDQKAGGAKTQAKRKKNWCDSCKSQAVPYYKK